MIEMGCKYLFVQCIWLYVIITLGTSFRVNPLSIVWLNIKEDLAQSRCYIWSLCESTQILTHKNPVGKWTLNRLAKLTKQLGCFGCTYLYGAFDCMLLSCYVRVSEWIHTLVCLNVKELLARRRHHMYNLSHRNEIWTQNHFVCKRTLNHLAKLGEWLSWVVKSYL